MPDSERIVTRFTTITGDDGITGSVQVTHADTDGDFHLKINGTGLFLSKSDLQRLYGAIAKALAASRDH